MAKACSISEIISDIDRVDQILESKNRKYNKKDGFLQFIWNLISIVEFNKILRMTLKRFLKGEGTPVFCSIFGKIKKWILYNYKKKKIVR